MSAPAETHYDVLGVGPRATPEQIDRAYRHTSGLYDEDALATYSLLDGEERRRALARVEAAYAVLRDPARRHAYDLEVGAASVPPRGAEVVVLPTAAEASSEERGAPLVARGPIVVLPDPVTGADLRRFRESRGISLRDIAAASKVGVRYLEYIEAERREVLPAPVYLRGFVQEYARVVGLDPRRTAASYLARVSSR